MTLSVFYTALLLPSYGGIWDNEGMGGIWGGPCTRFPSPSSSCASQSGSEVLEAPEHSQGDLHSRAPGKNKYLLENSELLWKVVEKNKDSSYLELAQALRSPGGLQSGKSGRDVSRGP